MGKWASDSLFLDKALDYLKANADLMTLCSAQPANYAEAATTYMLADAAMVTADFTIGNGDVSGRKVTVGAQAGEAVDFTGTGTHVALCDVGNTALIFVTTCASVAVDAAGTVDFGAWDIENADPV